MAKSNKETSVKTANEKASKVKGGNSELEKLIIIEAIKITEGKQHSVQQMMAYCRNLKK